MHLARHLIVSAVVLTSSSTLADAVFAKDEPAQITALIADEGNEIINFECTLPVFGSVRCGSPNRNVRVAAHKTLSAVVTAPIGKCASFKVYHAIDHNRELSPSIDVCGTGDPKALWYNNNDEAVDVYMMVASKDFMKFTLKGYYINPRP